MEKRDLLRFHYAHMEYDKGGQPMLTPRERSVVARQLAEMILGFFNTLGPSTNQEVIEILGLAVMYYHSVIYATGLAEIEEKS